MATRYILDPRGGIIKQTDNTHQSQPEDLIPEISEEMLPENFESYNDVDVDIADDFNIILDVANEQNNSFRNKILNKVPNDPSFGFVDDKTGSRDSFKPMYHFTDDNNRYFAKEFEMLTGYTGVLVGDTDEFNSKVQTDSLTFIFEYFIEIVSLLAIVETIASLNQILAQKTTNSTTTVERFDLRLGKYSIVEYDIYSRYIFTVLNYPKDHSTLLLRMTSFFVGFTTWMSPDDPIHINTIFEEANRKGSHQIENFLDKLGFTNENVFLGLGTSLYHIALSFIELSISVLTTASSYKRLNLLIKKFRQERIWRQSLYDLKDGAECKFLVDLDYYYFRFAIERINVGLKLLNRYAHKKTYLDPTHREGPLTRVSSNRTTQKLKNDLVISDDYKSKVTAETVKEVIGSYSWNGKDSDSSSYKPGMTTRLRALPQLLNMSNAFIKNLVFNKANTNKVFDLDKSIFQNFYKHKEENKKIPIELVKELEDYLESEYVPFYMHDLRTNELLSFHAFIESISDAFTPEYTSASGFGRIDDVKSYVKTTRNINLSFTIASTSETDHDFMWYQINKLVTMVYPQWSEGFITKDSESKPFFFPFTQVPTASPLVRIRLGDVLKNNYSRSSLSRIFGSELADAEIDDKNILKTKPIDFKSENNDLYELLPGLYKVESENFSFTPEDPFSRGYYEVKNPIRCLVEFDKNKPYHSVTIQPNVNSEGKNIDSDDLNKNKKNIILNVDSSKIIHKSKTMEGLGAQGFFTEFVDEIMKPFTGSDDNLISNNPITNSYESGMSRGIAGFITQLDINYNESNWETSRIGSKAPMLVKVTLNFSPVHDIPPGIDHNGMMRAPIYNVGRVNNQFFGDSHDTNVIGSGIDNAIRKYNKIKKSSENL